MIICQRKLGKSSVTCGEPATVIVHFVARVMPTEDWLAIERVCRHHASLIVAEATTSVVITSQAAPATHERCEFCGGGDIHSAGCWSQRD